MREPLLVIVTGPPCTGKTTLARRMAADLHLPLVTKDGIKETLFDTLGCHDLESSKRLGFASYELLFYFVEAQLAASRSHIVEANFFPAHAERFAALKRRYRFLPFQIHCCASDEIIQRRFIARAESGKRHRGHHDTLRLAEFENINWQTRHPVLEIGGEIREVETSDLAKLDNSSLFAAIERAQRSTNE